LFLHENLLVHDEESPQQKAIRLLNRQLGQLQSVRGLNHKSPEFKTWRDSTMEILERYLGKDSHHTERFRNTRFFGAMTITRFGSRPDPPGYVSGEDLNVFRNGCETLDASLKAAIRHVEDFGMHVEEPKPTSTGRGRSGGMSQTIQAATVHLNQAIATDSAIQRIGRVGNKTGVDLKELSNLLQQSLDLSPNQVKQGVADIEALAVEVEKPEEKRNWKSVLDSGQRVMELASKAVDLGAKLGPYLPAVYELVVQGEARSIKACASRDGVGAVRPRNGPPPRAILTFPFEACQDWLFGACRRTSRGIVSGRNMAQYRVRKFLSMRGPMNFKRASDEINIL
jgi:hypothetical protein